MNRSVDKSFIKINRYKFDIYNSKEDAFRAMADDMIDIIQKNNLKYQNTLLIVPVGPVGQYEYFVEKVINQNVSLKNVTFINMDEYMVSREEIIDSNHFLSFKRFMNESVYNKIPSDLNIPVAQRIFPDPKNPSHILDVILKHGYVDACYGGIGLNGHVAFNEPIKNLSKKNYMELPTRVVNIAQETLVTNALNELDGAFYNMPKYAITIGLKEILLSKKIRLFCFRNWHKSVINRLFSERSTTEFPVTLLQSHDDMIIGLTREILPKEIN